MALNNRELPFKVPSYSLTGDILSFQQCALQYRYYNGSSLPPSRPVQLWTGEFAHGVLEEAYRHWKINQPAFPWPCNQTPWPPPWTGPPRPSHDIGVLGDLVEARLTARGKNPRSSDARDFAYRRVEAAINMLAPHLFPLITSAERRISGTRPIPGGPNAMRGGGDRFELTGVVDVISSVTATANPANPLVQAIQQVTALVPAPFEVIVDYKAARRPSIQEPKWQQHEWQVQTYAWLCSQVPGAQPVGAGLLIYINELVPSRTDLEELRREIVNNETDMRPSNGSSDYYALHRWKPVAGGQFPTFSQQFLLARSIRVVDVSGSPVQRALSQIEHVVNQIEGSAINENTTGNIPQNWDASGDDRDCVACDFRHFCPNPFHRRNAVGVPISPPIAPG